ncbi:MAG: hypothetical protein H6736_22960 [Alphaproteobacteria bacterium]|nr:hypothetical protein [Alphaproteobacteria bacterium]MCB9694682.1 hypothetical protein [Alphaproteobacteria bacterium]
MSEVLEAAGSMGMMVVALGGLGVLVAIGLAALSITKRRVPLAAWVLIPFLITVIGAFGAWSNAGSVLGQIPGLDAGVLNETALAGLWQSVTIDWLSRWVAAGVLIVCTWAAGAGATVAAGTADETALTPVSAGTAAVGAILGAIALGVYGVSNSLATEAYLLAGVVLVGGLGVAFASVRRALYESCYRVAGMRFTAAACFVIATFFASRAVSMGTQIAMFGPNGQANHQTLDNAVRMWNEVADPVWTMALAAFLIALVIAFLGMYSELGEIVQRFTLVDIWATCALILVLTGVRGLENMRTDALAGVGTHMPATDIFARWGNDLPTSVVQVEKNPLITRPSPGGYGDVLAFQSFPIGYRDDGTPITKAEWRRIYAWDGSSWYADDTPLDCEGHTGSCTPVTVNSVRTPLLAIGKGEPATDLLAAAEKMPGGEFMLLLRALDVGSDVAVPHQLAHGQVTFLKMKVDAPVDLTKELWVDAGYKEMFWGPTHWFGEGDDKDAIVYAKAILEETKAPGLHVLVSEKARVEGVANSCVSVASRYDDGKVTPADTWCSITKGDVQEWRAKAREVTPVPEPEFVRVSFPKIEGPIDNDLVKDVFSRETGAVAYCQELAHAKALEDYDPDDEESELAPTDGRMELSVVINDRGKMNGTYIEDRSRLQNRELSGCIAKRYRKLQFDELPKPPPPAEGEEKPEPPSATIWITYDFKKLPTE